MSETASAGRLGDTPERSYGTKLELFNRFAEPEIRAVIDSLGIRAGDRILDAGCGVGLVTGWFAESVGPEGRVVGVELSYDHIKEALRLVKGESLPLQFVQGDISQVLYPPASFDLVWLNNVVNHLNDPVAGMRTLSAAVRPGGRLVVAQSAFLPDMFFAWDERLEGEVTRAVRRYYREKYGLSDHDTAGMRGLYGWMGEAGLHDVRARTVVIERTAPLSDLDREYFQRTVFEGYWAHRVRPYLSDGDWGAVKRLTTPGSPDYALDRPDFHHIQTFTVVIGEVARK